MTTVDPVGPIHLGGLMARNPAGPPENYAFIVVGRDENDISVETKTTTNGASTYVGPTWPTADAELRLCRVGTSFTVYKRPLAGGAWTLAQTFTRADLPQSLQVGPFIYANTNQPDFEALFDEVTFAPVTNAADCMN
jgi:hypothetical protein